MEKKNNLLVILVVVLSVLVGVLGSFIIYDKVLVKDDNVEDKTSGNDKNSNENTNVEDKEIDSDSEKKKYYGTYTVKYYENVDKDIKANKESSITLNSDNTFVFTYNVCAYMMDVKGTYEVKDNKIILSNLTADFQDVLESHLNGRNNLEFIIVSENEIYLSFEHELACTIAGNKYGTFVKE